MGASTPILHALVLLLSLSSCWAMASASSLAGFGATAATSAAPRIAVVGAGAAGLAAGRVFARVGWETKVLEKDQSVGGVWNYQDGDESRPMYRNLRTNLPKEIMAYREYPWPSMAESFLTHRQVHEYLRQYADRFNVEVDFGCTVERLRMDVDGPPSCFSPSDTEVWPRVELTWREDKKTVTEYFDAVCIANGHYSLPSIPDLPGMKTNFDGEVMHSIVYDEPSAFEGKVVLCIGGRASGSDIAREIATAGAAHVYISDAARTDGDAKKLDSITWVPRTIEILRGGIVKFDHGCEVQPKVDVIIFCSGYDYCFPFIQEDSGIELDTSTRRVTPLYEQLWHAEYPNLAFVGLPHSILPFPLFELQAEASFHQWKTGGFPPKTDRLTEAAHAAISGGEAKKSGRIKDSHYLGSAQWEYCRRLAKYGNIYDNKFESYLTTNEALWDLTGNERRGEFPGGPDDYRSSIFARNHDDQSYAMVESIISGVSRSVEATRK